MNSKKTIVLLSGYTTDKNGNHGSIGAGKTRVAGALASTILNTPIVSLGFVDTQTWPTLWSLTSLSFAEPLKRALQEVEVLKTQPEFREIIQRFSEIILEFDQNRFTRMLYERAMNASASVVVVDDWRLLREYVWLSRQDGIKLVTVRVKRNVTECPQGAFEDELALLTDATFDIVVDNNGKIEETVQQILEGLKSLRWENELEKEHGI